MENTLFLHSGHSNPYDFYKKMRLEQPVYWDDQNKIWALYSYRDCYFLLNSDLVEIPQIPNAHLNENATIVIENLARLNNLSVHSETRKAALYLFEKIKAIEISMLLDALLAQMDLKSFDFVKTIGKKLPALLLLKGFGFGDSEVELILPKISTLIQLMLPDKTEQQIAALNLCIDDIFLTVEKHLIDTITIDTRKEAPAIYVSNLIGLLIQCYDAGRGLLCNALLQSIQPQKKGLKDGNYFRKAIVETIRFDSPIQNTRRKLTEDITLRNQDLKKGQQLLLVLASANRDEAEFVNPDRFDIDRINNNESLTFGSGRHSCLAKYFSINLVFETLMYFSRAFKDIRLIEEEIQFEPLVNARLVRRMLISIE
jgi:cytochrome P450